MYALQKLVGRDDPDPARLVRRLVGGHHFKHVVRGAWRAVVRVVAEREAARHVDAPLRASFRVAGSWCARRETSAFRAGDCGALEMQMFEPNAIPCGVFATPNWQDTSPQFLKTPVELGTVPSIPRRSPSRRSRPSRQTRLRARNPGPAVAAVHPGSQQGSVTPAFLCLLQIRGRQQIRRHQARSR